MAAHQYMTSVPEDIYNQQLNDKNKPVLNLLPTS